MLQVDIPGGPSYRLSHLVLDYNGTIARDGELLAGVVERLRQLAELLTVHVVTADTHGTVRARLAGLPCRVEIIGAAEQDRCKKEYVLALGAEGVVAVGNGYNDALMLRQAALGIALVQTEGAASAALLAADLVCLAVTDALDLLLRPKRLVATLRR